MEETQGTDHFSVRTRVPQTHPERECSTRRDWLFSSGKLAS